MADPLHVDGPTVRIATPTEDWETRTGAIEEGPFAFVRDGITYLLYSASASWTPNDYAVGVLINTSGDLLNPDAWIKRGPIFDHHGTAYGPGAVVFVNSPDGSELWTVYHAYDQPHCAQWACRNIRMQRVAWNAEGPVLGYPVNPNVPLFIPAGDAGSPTGWGDAWLGTAAAGVWRYYSRSMLESSHGEDATGLHQTFRGDVNLFAYTVSVDVAQHPDSAGRSSAQYGLYALFYDSNNYVQAFIDADAGVFASRAVLAGVDQGLCSKPLPDGFDFAKLHRIVVEKSAAGQFTFYLDGTQIDQRWIRLQRGQIGVFTYNTAARFERVAIEDRSFGWGDAFADAAEGLEAGPPGKSSDGYIRGAWEIGDGSMVTSRGGDPGWSTLYRGNPNLRNYTVAADVRLARAGASDRPRYGLIVCHDDRNNQVTLWVDPAARVLAINSVINGDSRWRTAGLPADFDAAAFHSIAASKSGDQFTFLLDGVEILREEVALSTGMAGV
jgi:hypothetical protein